MSELEKNTNEEMISSVTPAEKQETVQQAAENIVKKAADRTSGIAEDIKEAVHDTAEEMKADIQDAAETVKEDVHEVLEDFRESEPVKSTGEEMASVREELEKDLSAAAEETLPPLPEIPEFKEETAETPAEENITLPEIPAETEPEEQIELVLPAVPAAAEEEVKAEAPAEEPAEVHEEAASQPEEPVQTYTEEPVKETKAPETKKEEPAVPAPVVQQVVVKKSHPVLTTLLAGVVGLASGFGGGYMAFRTFGNEPEEEVPAMITDEEPETAEAETAEEETQQTAAASAGELSIREIAAKAQPSVVEIVVEIESTGYGYGFFGQQSYTSQAAGSGVIISDDGYIITNNHVIEGAKSITVTLYDGTTYTAEMIGTDEKTDIGVIKINANHLPAAEIGDSSLIQTGDTAIVIGNPLGTLGGTVTNGIVSATNREVTIDNETYELIQTDAAINSGNSGGGLFDGQGKLIGVVNSKDSGTTSSGAIIEGLGFAIPINTAMDVAEQLIEYGYVADRATLGVYIQVLTEAYGSYSEGLYITDVIKGGGAEKAGLQSYDKIISADGTKISSYQDLSTFLKKKKVGDTITLTIERDGHKMDVDVTLTGPINETYEG